MTEQKKLNKRPSEIFQEVIAGAKGDGDISVGEVLALLGGKSFCLAILVLAVPNCLPIPNVLGFSALTGVPIILLSIQMILGRKTPWLPDIIANHHFSRTKLAGFLTRILPYICRIERVFFPRMFFVSKITERLVGVVFLVFAIVLSLPIPFGNLVPGFAISLIAIGFMERDGLMMAVGLVFGIISCLIIFTAIKAIFVSVIGLFF